MSLPSPSQRLCEILERNRETHSPELPAELVATLAEIEERDQFDDDRQRAKSDIREVIADAAKLASHEESS